MKLTGFQTFCLYKALKAHFNSSYDFNLYGGKTSNTTVAGFEKRPDKFKFNKLSCLYSDEDMKDLLIANFRDNPRSWIGDLIGDEAKKPMFRLQKTRNSLSYIFTQNLETILAPGNISALIIHSGKIPAILYSLYNDEIEQESFLILDHFLKFTTKWRSLDSLTLWKKKQFLLDKYASFLTFDEKKCKQILLDKLKSIC